MGLPSTFSMKKRVLNRWRRLPDYTLGRLNIMSRIALTWVVAMEENVGWVLTLLFSTIISEMLFEELDISCATERFFFWFLANWLEKVDTGCQAFPLIHCWFCPRQWWTFNLHWVNIHKGFTLGVNKFYTINRVPKPFGGCLWYLTIRAKMHFSPLQLCLWTWCPWSHDSANHSFF